MSGFLMVLLAWSVGLPFVVAAAAEAAVARARRRPRRQQAGRYLLYSRVWRRRP